jgi:hypothetical protein
VQPAYGQHSRMLCAPKATAFSGTNHTLDTRLEGRLSTRSGHSRSRATWALIPHCGHCRKPGKINMISESALHAGRAASDSFTDDHKQFFTKFRDALPTHALKGPFY